MSKASEIVAMSKLLNVSIEGTKKAAAEAAWKACHPSNPPYSLYFFTDDSIMYINGNKAEAFNNLEAMGKWEASACL